MIFIIPPAKERPECMFLVLFVYVSQTLLKTGREVDEPMQF